MLEEMEDTQINVSVKEAFDSQMTVFTSDMKTLLIEDAKEKLDGHFKSTDEHLIQVINTTATHARAPIAGTTYASMLAAPPPHANPRVAA